MREALIAARGRGVGTFDGEFIEPRWLPGALREVDLVGKDAGGRVIEDLADREQFPRVGGVHDVSGVLDLSAEPLPEELAVGRPEAVSLEARSDVVDPEPTLRIDGDAGNLAEAILLEPSLRRRSAGRTEAAERPAFAREHVDLPRAALGDPVAADERAGGVAVGA